MYSDKLSIDFLHRVKPFITVSYNYDYIVSKACIDEIRGNIINMHISLLPWNRGFSPNIWSFIDETPKGVTIHMMSEGLDEGDILYQSKMNFDATKETFETTYNALNREIVELFKNNWEDIISGNYKKRARAQQGTGSYHDMKDLKYLQNSLPFEWSDTVSDFLLKYENFRKNTTQ